MPIGHPIGYDFDQDIPGWDGVTYTPPEIEGAVDLPVISLRSYIDFLDPEVERSAKNGLFIEPSMHGPDGAGNNQAHHTDDGRTHPMVDSPEVGGDTNTRDTTSGVKSEEEIIRDFLRRVGLSEASISGSTTEMMYYLRGCLRL